MSDYIRPLTSYCSRMYVIQVLDPEIKGWRDVENMPADWTEEHMKEYLKEHYDATSYRLIQVVISEIYYVVA